ncbi:MAG: transporter substrate-binding domain-containing protein [Candidatus Sabulitectum sp.]|nr:transporter substrate-binding domain-containing protein [Candidatus Sabulitectum sp.]
MSLPFRSHRESAALPFIYLLLFTLTIPQVYAREVRVGFYENYPKVFTSDDGTPSGIFVDILESIANDEQWTLYYVHGNWSECLERLESGDIDLMVDVAFSEARDEIYDFCESNILSNWAQVYTRNNLEIDILTDLNGMRISAIRSGIHLTRLEALIDGFSIDCEIVVVDDYETVFSLLQSEEVDAGVVNRVFGHANADSFNVSKSPVIFSPASLRYAVKKGCNADLIVAIDKCFTVMAEDPGSIYHQTLRKWLGETSKFTTPEWVRISLFSISTILILFFAVSIILRYQVRRKTTDLQKANLELSKQVEETMKAHLDLKRSEEIRIRQERISALGQMVFGIAHDFNNMLTPILGYSDLILENQLTVIPLKEQLDYVQIIRSAAADARETVKRLQESMRADTRTKTEAVLVAKLISEVVGAIQPIIKSKPENIYIPIAAYHPISHVQ